MIAKRDTPEARKLSGQRLALVEPVLGNIRTHKRCDRLTWRGKITGNRQWRLYGRVQNREKIVHEGMAASTGGAERLFQTRDRNQRGLDGLSAFAMRGTQSQGSVDSASPTSPSLSVRRRPLVQRPFATVSTVAYKRPPIAYARAAPRLPAAGERSRKVWPNLLGADVCGARCDRYPPLDERKWLMPFQPNRFSCVYGPW
jgi:hypothetical protein